MSGSAPQQYSGSVRPWRSPWAVCIPVFLACFVLYTRHNDFPLHRQCHYDEPRKVKSILEGYQNYNHPLLMLMGTHAARLLSGRPDDPHRVAVLGRTVSALFAALAVTALTYLAFLEAGSLAALCVGSITALLPVLLRLSHFLKEDPSLLLGFSCFLLAAALFFRRRSLTNVILLGAACGLAASAKYVGVVAFFVSLVLVLRSGGDESVSRRRRALALGLAFLAVCAVISFPWFLDLHRGLHDARGEVRHSLRGHAGLRPDRLTLPYARFLVDDVIPPVLLLAAGFVAATAWKWRKRSASDRLVVLFAAGYFLLLSLSPLQRARYLLPVEVLVCYMAGRALAWATVSQPWRAPLRIGLAVLCLGAVLAWEGMQCGGELRRFANSRLPDLAGWIRMHVPPGSRIAQDLTVDLPERIAFDDGRAPIEIVGPKLMVADVLGTLDKAREEGFTYIAVCRDSYVSLFARQLAAVPGKEDDRARRRAFYRDLAREGELVWHYVPAGDTLFSEMRLYRLPEPGG